MSLIRFQPSQGGDDFLHITPSPSSPRITPTTAQFHYVSTQAAHLVTQKDVHTGLSHLATETRPSACSSVRL
jgi:hypothetical protein